MNLFETLKPEHPEDVARIRLAVPILGRFTDTEVDKLYQSFSRTYAASWLNATEENIANFALWLSE